MNIKTSKKILRFELVIMVFLLFYKFSDICQELLSSEKMYTKNTLVSDVIKNNTEKQKVEKVIIYSKKADNTDEKIIRKGLFVAPKEAKASVLVCHGFTCDKNDIDFMRYMIFKDFNCMTFDFRAHGENRAGQFCTLGKDEAYDVIAAAKYLRSRPECAGKPLIAYAFSMGAVSAIEAQAKDPSLFDAMVLDCPFDSTENVIKRGLDNKKICIFGYEFDVPGKTILKKYLFHPYVQAFVKALLISAGQINTESINVFARPVFPSESIKKIKVPCFIIHCKNDEKIAIENIKTIYYNAASSYKKLWLTEGKRHFGSFFYNPEEYTKKVHKFVERVADGQVFGMNKHKIVEEPSDKDLPVEIKSPEQIKVNDMVLGKTFNTALGVKDTKVFIR